MKGTYQNLFLNQDFEKIPLKDLYDEVIGAKRKVID